MRRSAIVTQGVRLGGQPLAALSLARADAAVVARMLAAGRSDPAVDLELGRTLLELGNATEALAEIFRRGAASARTNGSKSLALQAELGEVEALAMTRDHADARRLFTATAAARASCGIARDARRRTRDASKRR